jgi:hypothetical protein
LKLHEFVGLRCANPTYKIAVVAAENGIKIA